MNVDSTLIYAIAGFTALGALSMLGQFIATFLMLKKVQELQASVMPLVPRAEAALEAARLALAEGRDNLRQIAEKTNDFLTRSNDLMESARLQMARIEDVVVDATGKAKAQLERVDMVVEDTVSRVHETVAMLHRGVLKPIKQVNGVAAGLQAGIAALLKGNRPSVSQATQDEEMFI